MRDESLAGNREGGLKGGSGGGENDWRLLKAIANYEELLNAEEQDMVAIAAAEEAHEEAVKKRNKLTVEKSIGGSGKNSA